MYPRLVLVISTGGIVAMTEEELMIVVMMIMMMMFSRGKGGGGNFRSADSCVQEWAVPWYTSVCGCVHGPVGIVIIFCNFVYDEITDGHFEGVMTYAFLLVDY